MPAHLQIALAAS